MALLPFLRLKVKLNRFFGLDDIAINNADLVNIVLAQLSRNFCDVPSKSFKRICTLVVIAHSAGWHEVVKVICSSVLNSPRPQWLKMVYLHILVGDFASTIRTVAIILSVDRFTL